MRLALALFCLYTICAVNSLRILGIFPTASYSHYSLGKVIMEELAEKGHDVTFISPYTENNSKYRSVELTGFHEKSEEMKSQLNMFEATSSAFGSLFLLHGMGYALTNQTLAHPNTQKLLASKEKFDVIVLEQFVNEALRGFCHHFNAPCVILSSVGSSYWTNHLVGNPSNPAYINEMFFTNSWPPGLVKRAYNTAMTTLADILVHNYFLPQQNQLLKQYFPKSPELSELLYNTPLVLLNSHVSTAAPVPHVPNMIEIGGYHVQPPKKLPQDLQKYLDEAKEGVIYFSMGSNLRSREIPVEKRDAILKAFSKLKMKVLWKFEEDNLPGKPGNVMIKKWLPQQDILAHPNIKLFITHGGLLSTIEAIYHGVPVIGIPIYGDQSMNMVAAVEGGFGISLEYKELDEQKLTDALQKIINDPKYSKSAKLRSKLMHDQPMKPMDTARFWIEYVARHKGAKHFRSAAMDLKWYQLMLLDVIAVYLLVAFTLLYVTSFVLRKLLRRSKKTENEKTKLKKNK